MLRTPSKPAARSRARAASGSDTATSLAPAILFTTRSAWSAPIMPTPITPMRRSRTAIYFSSLRLSANSSCDFGRLLLGKPRVQRPVVDHVRRRDLPGVHAPQLVAELRQLLAAGHLPGELVQRELVAVCVEDHPAELEDDEVVADEVGVVRVVGDEDDPETGVARLDDVLQDHARLLHAERRRRLVEDDDLGTEVDRPGDRDALALAAGQAPDGALEVGDDDAHLRELLVATRFMASMSRFRKGPL